ncbi:SHOCT domain-containing protein [Streptomyces sp. NPDC005409]|uniref:SHOCT domain-containing protein n=1 Tax=Streptomyces sp. NPDC005409 TaxID=3155342 RepID=UPI0034545FF4
MFIRPVGVTVRSADRPAGRPLLQGLLARAAGSAQGGVADEPRHGVRWRPAERIERAEPRHEPEPEPEPELEPELEPEPEPDPEPEPGEWLEAGFSDFPPPGAPSGGPAPQAGLVAELTQLAALAREGLLTPEEFATAKARLLRG